MCVGQIYALLFFFGHHLSERFEYYLRPSSLLIGNLVLLPHLLDQRFEDETSVYLILSPHTMYFPSLVLSPSVPSSFSKYPGSTGLHHFSGNTRAQRCF